LSEARPAETSLRKDHVTDNSEGEEKRERDIIVVDRGEKSARERVSESEERRFDLCPDFSDPLVQKVIRTGTCEKNYRKLLIILPFL